MSDKSVTSPSINHLKLHAEHSMASLRADIDHGASLKAACRAFEKVTGWSLIYHRGSKPIHPTEFTWAAPDNPGVGTSLGHARLALVRSASADSESVETTKSVRRLASALELLNGRAASTKQLGCIRQHAIAMRRMPDRFVDLQTPQIHGPNVPPPGLEHRQVILEYYWGRMEASSGKAK